MDKGEAIGGGDRLQVGTYLLQRRIRHTVQGWPRLRLGWVLPHSQGTYHLRRRVSGRHEVQ